MSTLGICSKKVQLPLKLRRWNARRNPVPLNKLRIPGFLSLSLDPSQVSTPLPSWPLATRRPPCHPASAVRHDDRRRLVMPDADGLVMVGREADGAVPVFYNSQKICKKYRLNFYV